MNDLKTFWQFFFFFFTFSQNVFDQRCYVSSVDNWHQVTVKLSVKVAIIHNTCLSRYSSPKFLHTN